jgi:hypothetical protein
MQGTLTDPNSLKRLADSIRAVNDTELLAKVIESIEVDSDEFMTIDDLCDEIDNYDF